MAIVFQLWRYILNIFRKILHTVLTLLKIGAVVVSLCLIAMLVAGSILVFKPHWLINTRTVGWLAERSDLTGYEVRSKKLLARITSESWRYKSIMVSARDFQVRPVQDGSFSAGGSFISVEAGVDLLGSPVLLRRLGPMEAVDTTVTVMTAADTQEREPTVSWRTVLRHLRYVELKPVTVSNLIVTLRPAIGPEQSLRITANTQFAEKDITVEAKVQSLSPAQPFQSASATMKADTTYFEGPDRAAGAQFDVRIKGMRSGGRIDFRSGADGSHRVRASINLPRELAGGDIALNAAGAVKGSDISLQLTGLFKPSHNILRQLTLDHCRIDAVLFPTDGRDIIKASDCILDASFNKFLKGRSRLIPAPEKLRFDIAGTVRADSHSRSSVSGSIKARVREFVSPLYRLSGEADARFAGNPASPGKIGLTLNSDFAVDVDHFEKVVTYLQGTSLAIPAPFNSLQGHLSCSLRGSVSSKKGTAMLPLVCTTNLHDGIQTIETALEGKVTTELGSGKTNIDFDVTLDHVTIAAPEIEVTAKLPKLRPDPRFIDGLDPDGFFQDGEWIDPQRTPPPPSRETALQITYRVRVKTGRQPFRIATGLADGDVPLNFNLLLVGDQPIQGYVAAQPFTVTVVKKKIGVQLARINFQADGMKPIDAEFTLEKTNQKITVTVFGTVARPRYQITSDPPLSEADAVAGILYNTTDLNAAQQTSVAETRAAMADGAIGLISMFFLASTPVESVGYNPHTGIFSANVRVREGVSLQVGSNFEGEKRIGIVKNLWGKWSFEAFALSGTTEEEGRGVAMFRWSNRY
jgi:hypothetical protein